MLSKYFNFENYLRRLGNMGNIKFNIKAAAFQFPVHQGLWVKNMECIAEGLAKRKADLVVLPELCSSGYFLNKEAWYWISSDRNWKLTIGLFENLSKEIHSHLVFSIPKKLHDKIYNVSYLINEDGILGSQTKIHITDDEKVIFSPNPIKRINPIETDFGKIAIISCFDLWDSSLFKQVKIEKAGLICSPCAFGSDLSPNIAKSRAMEFNTPVILSNRTGTEIFDGVSESFIGMSSIWDSSGKAISQATLETEFISNQLEINNTESLPFCKNLPKEMGWV